MWVGVGVCAGSTGRFSFAASEGDSGARARGDGVTAIGSRTDHCSEMGARGGTSGRKGSCADACFGSGHACSGAAVCAEIRSKDGEAYAADGDVYAADGDVYADSGSCASGSAMIGFAAFSDITGS